MKYLVCRLDAIRPDGYMRGSEFFPMLVETDPDGPTMTYEDIVKTAFDRINRNKCGDGYIGYHDYIVVPLNEAVIVSFRKPLTYEVSQRPFTSWEK